MEDFDNLSKLLSQCPKYNKLYMLSSTGNGFVRATPRDNWVSETITSGFCVIYNDGSSALSTKSIYLDNKDRPYIKHDGRKLLMEEFKCQQD